MSLQDLSSFARFLRENDVERVNAIPDKMRCIMCSHVLVDAHRAPCGCKYCRECVDCLIERQVQFCPGTSPLCEAARVSSCLPDYKTSMKISQLTVTCPAPQCAHECRLTGLEDHLRVCSMNVRRNTSAVLTDANDMRGHASRMCCEDSKLLVDWICELRSELVAIRQDGENGKNETEFLKKELLRKEEQLESMRGLLETLENKVQACEQDIKSIKEQETRPAATAAAVPQEVVLARPEIPAGVARGWRAGRVEPTSHEIVYTVTDVAAFRKKSYYGEFSDFSYGGGGGDCLKYQLGIWNSGDDLTSYLRLYATERDDQVRWPLRADLTITVSSSSSPKAAKSSKMFCQFDRPPDKSCRSSQIFTFPYSELEDAGLLADNAIAVSCLVETHCSSSS